MNTTPRVMTRGIDNKPDLLCARDVFPNDLDTDRLCAVQRLTP
jgi:hypothetical protein